MNSKRIKSQKLPKHRYIELKHLCLQYNDLKDELAEMTAISAVNLDGMPKGTTTGDPTGQAALEYEKLHSKLSAIERCAAATGDYAKAVLKSVTTEGCTYQWLRNHGYAYFGKNQFYEARSLFFFLLDKEI